MRRLVFTFNLLLYLFFTMAFPVERVYAESPTSTTQITTVKRAANLRDRIWERVTLFFKFSNNDKADYLQYLVEKRFGELIYVFDNGQGDMIEETSSRYSSYLGRLTDLIVKNKMVGRKEGVLKMIDRHKPVLEELLARQDYESGFWLLLKHDINYLKLYRDQIETLN